MWLWERDARRDDGPERALARDLASLRDWYRRTEVPRAAGKMPAAWGYGFGWNHARSTKKPMVLLSQAAFREAKPRSSYDDFFMRPVGVDELLSEGEIGALDLPRLELPLVAMVVETPRRSASTALRLRNAVWPSQRQICCAETGRTGTVGLRLSHSDAGTTYLTAGHIFPRGAGSSVDYFPRGWLWPRRKRLGSVVFQNVPTNSPDWDIAVIRSVGSEGAHWIGERLTKTRGTRERQGEELVYANGATSGFVDLAVLVGGLEEVAGWNIKWRCCWLIAPSDVLTNGDSGAAVYMHGSGELLGTYVGASKLAGARRPHAHYVQDAWSLEQQFFKLHSPTT